MSRYRATTPWRIYLVVGLDLIGFATLMPLLASYGDRVGASPAAIGFLVASYSIMHIVLAGWWGRLSDRLGRKPILLIGLLGSILGALVFAVADRWIILVLSRVIAGGAGATINVAQAYLADVTPARGRTRAMGLLGATYGVGFIVGPILGGVASRFGDAVPGVVAAASPLLGLLLTLLLVGEPEEHKPRRSAPPDWIPPRERWTLFIASASITAAFTVMYVVFPLFGEGALGYDRSQVSYLFAYVGIGNAIAQGGLAGRSASWIGEKRTGLLGTAIMSAGFLAVPLVTRLSQPLMLPWFLLALLAVALGFGLAGPSLTGRLSQLAGPSQGRLLGQMQSVNSFARAAGPVMAGLIYGLAGPAIAFAASAGLGVLAMLVLARGGGQTPTDAAGVDPAPSVTSTR